MVMMPPSGTAQALTGPAWQQGWVRLLDELDDPGRVRRGRSYARNARVQQVAIAVGEVTALVRGSGWWNYAVRLRIPTLPSTFWQRLTARLAGDLYLEAALLGGELPEEIDQIARELGAPLLPEHLGELGQHCECEDWVRPCKHLIAVLLLTGEALAQSPQLVLGMRGAPLAEMLAWLAAERPPAVHDPLFDLEPEPEAPPGFWTGSRPPPAIAAQPEPAPGASVLSELGIPSFSLDRPSFLRIMEQAYRGMQRRAGAELGFAVLEPAQRRGKKN